MAKFRLVRSVRTLSSEIYLIWDNDRQVGQLDVHYADNIIYGDLMLEGEISEREKERLYQQIDEDIVSSYMPTFERDEFILTVFQGQEIESLSYPPMEEELEEPEEPGEE